MIYQHTARVIPEKQTSHLPAAVLLCGVSKGIDMFERKRFIVGDCAEVETAGGVGSVIISMTADVADLNGKGVSEIPEIEDVEIITFGPYTPEQAYLLGKSLLMAARLNGVSE